MTGIRGNTLILANTRKHKQLLYFKVLYMCPHSVQLWNSSSVFSEISVLLFVFLGSALYAALKVVHYHDTVHHNLTRILFMKAFLEH